MNISEVLFVMAAMATILDFLWKVGRWVVGRKRERMTNRRKNKPGGHPALIRSYCVARLVA